VAEKLGEYDANVVLAARRTDLLEANIVLAARRTDLLEEVANQVRAGGGQALVVTTDASQP
jgi:NADP-dependent 3-hydroxy acid dehydrogenase YdfG